MRVAQIVTPWAEFEDGDRFYPEYLDHYPHKMGEMATDVTMQPVESIPPDPNAFTLEIVVEETTFAVVVADSRYVILWSDDDRERVLTPAAAASLIAKLAVYGYQAQDLAGIIRSGITREAAADALIQHQRKAPRESGV